MIKAEGIDMNEPGENITLPTITTTTPSPIDIQTTTVIPPQEKGKETGKRKKEKKKKDKKKKEEEEVTATTTTTTGALGGGHKGQIAKPKDIDLKLKLSSQPKKMDKKEKKKKKEAEASMPTKKKIEPKKIQVQEAPANKKEEKKTDEFVEDIRNCPDPNMDIPTSIVWGQEIQISITGTCYKRYELRMPPYERAPFNLHFNLYTRDRKGKGCEGLVMRLRKNCGDTSINPQACKYICIYIYIIIRHRQNTFSFLFSSIIKNK